MELAAEHEAGAEAGADREEDEVLDAARDASPLLAERGEVDVVLERHRQLEPLGELVARAPPSRPGTFVERRRRSRRDDARHADDHPVEKIARQAARLDERRCELRDASTPLRLGGRRARRPGAHDVAARSQIAPRRKRAPRSRPSTSAASGTRSKKTAP